MATIEDLTTFLGRTGSASRSQIKAAIDFQGSDSSLKRLISAALERGQIEASGIGRGTKYSLPIKHGIAPKRYPDGIQTFERIVEEGYVYVDKTKLLYDLTHSNSRYVFLSRPRRFGKSLLISTLKSYFEGRADLFEGLTIADLETEWTEHPVVRLDLSSAGDVLDKEQLYIKLARILRENENALGLPNNDSLPGERLEAIVCNAYAKFGKKVVLLVDEYDAPLLGTLNNEELGSTFRIILKELFSPVKSLDPYLHFTLLTGITKYSQMSLFSTLNNLNDISMDDRYATICGFTDEELDSVFSSDISFLAQQLGSSLTAIRERLKQQYDGYHFSPAGKGVYNPFSVLRAFSNMKLEDYWFASGTPSLLIDALKRFNTDISDIDGVEAMPSLFNQPTDSANNAVSLFYQSGYLTIRSFNPEFNTFTLTIPNAEVRAGLMDNLLPATLAKNPIETQNLAIRFKRALLANDISGAIEILKSFFASIPYPEFGDAGSDTFQKKEAYFKRLFYLVFSFMNVQIYTEVMNSQGRTDAIMILADTVYIVEAKVDAPSAVAALKQIEEKGYADRFAGSGRKICRLGLNFSSKTRTISDWVIN